MTYTRGLYVLFAAGFGVPWILCWAPYRARLVVIPVLGVIGLILWFTGLRKRSQGGMKAVAGAWLISIAGASLWIALASFSAEISKVPTTWLYIVVLTTIGILPLWTCLVAPCASCSRLLLLAFTIALEASVFQVRPARRYETPRNTSAIHEVAAPLQGVGACVRWVHEHVDRRRAPFTDDALDTLRRREAHCGGMANLLHKMLETKDIPARIVHFSVRDNIHTLVEYRDASNGRWILADPQNNILGTDWQGVAGWDVVRLNGERLLPDEWRDFDTLYVYEPGRGYVKVTPANHDNVYDDPEGDTP